MGTEEFKNKIKIVEFKSNVATKEGPGVISIGKNQNHWESGQQCGLGERCWRTWTFSVFMKYYYKQKGNEKHKG